ncbi:UDP-N-acetylmuramoyl-L-alanyl-D-glutamate--2,6-diaminopimelate ligase [Xylanibacillus composti]|uniref:UDP-N-acetylmuramoyl-L-alanyl-D-glutamate--2,6-diaminopimelate ligase n=1 Tax=Xylanibacillus composti TaxID=1572762 RepID=A0A8J4H212_9BACL|nr:UDP-N-acetylmuramoyl-L-alanyl-D-glutamate--2,6-diaminopimelate ligase [Xylanibacillus composti]MDT9724371.1 UDP-N-acetylmuramoyl-L-alanyl-D-glutamate--2,6-diaminopimelate ligase [Xylanibacillus composti]GIQ67962.1 UDP-N-acetylmuramoyl-L-alanyl-D-glutamate--2,6-diaminopimelate ligase [Xylanibacillus composti]
MQLKQLTELLLLSRIAGNPDTEFTGVETDSRKVRPGDLFICITGHRTDGHAYAAQAEQQGASAIVAEKPLQTSLPVLYVPDSRFAMALIATAFYRNPSLEMKVIGITGTNGKTTTTYILEKILRDHHFRTGLMGTIAMKIGDQEYEVKNTTQEALELQRHFREMRNVGTDYCVMEVSSHALEQGRVRGCRFRTAIFTNLSQDHLDYHLTMANYKAAKGLLFSRMGNTFDPAFPQFAVLNADDPASDTYRRHTSAQVITYGIDNPADVWASDIRITAQGTSFRMRTFAGELDLKLKLIGKFSVYNVLAASAAALAEGVPLSRIQSSLEEMTGVSGRFEAVYEGQPFLVIVDYAHTPDSLENVLATIREFAEGKVITLFGCGGDRDRSKRPIMGKIAGNYSDYVIVTSDNPRTEDPEAILRDIEPGVREAGLEPDRYELLADRKAAIQKAVALASPKDVVLIAGKGHETYQEIGVTRYDFDDRLVAKNAIRSLGH